MVPKKEGSGLHNGFGWMAMVQNGNWGLDQWKATGGDMGVGKIGSDKGDVSCLKAGGGFLLVRGRLQMEYQR